MHPDLQASYDFCARVARREARNFYPSFLLLPAERRRSMCALYAFLRRSDDIADEPGELEAKKRRLAAWRTGFAAVGYFDPAACALGPDTADWPGWLAWFDTIRRHAIPLEYPLEVLRGVESDLDPRPFATFDDLHTYCYRVASAVGLCCLHIWGFESDGGRAENLAEATGLALQLTNILRDVKEDAQNGRVYLPLDDLSRFGVTSADLTAATAGDSLRRLLAFEGRRAYDYYEQAQALAPLVSPVGRPVLQAIVGIYRALLDEIARRGYDVLPARVRVPSWRKAAITARALAGRLISPGSGPDPGAVEVTRPR